MVKANLQLVEKVGEIKSRITDALQKEVSAKVPVIINKLVGKVRAIVKAHIMKQPEIASLTSGRLRGEFGLRDGGAAINEIIDLWTKDINVSYIRSRSKIRTIKFTVTITMIRRDFSDVLSLPASRVITEKGQSLPWLEWLLKFGDRQIVRDFDVSFTRGRLARSRSGLAVMVKGKGKRWGVPKEFAGTIRNNFVTRALEEAKSPLILAMTREFSSI